MNDIVEYISCVVDIIIVFIYFNGVLGRKEQIGRLYWVYFIGAVAINTLRTQLFLPLAPNIAVTAVLWFIIAVLCFEGLFRKKLFFVGLNIVAILAADILTSVFQAIFLETAYSDRFTMRAVAIALTSFILFVLNTFIIYTAKKHYRDLPLKYNVLMILCPLVSLYILLLLDTYVSQIETNNYIFPLIAVFGLGYINVMIFDFFDYYEKGLQAQTLNVLLNAQEENYKILEQNETELRILRHDILRCMTEIKAIINSGEQEKAQQYVEEVNRKVLEDTSVSRTKNLVLDTILNAENKKAVSRGIQYDVKLNIVEDITISSVDLSRILYNAIDNAIEACEKVSKKYILVSISSGGGQLKITVENTSLPVMIENNKIKTTKADKSKHGYGIKSIKEALRRSDGFVTFSYDDGMFVCRMVMSNKSTQ